MEQPASMRPFTRAAALLGLSAAGLGGAVAVLNLLGVAPAPGLALFGGRTITALALALGGAAIAALHRAPGQAAVRAAAIAAALGVAGVGGVSLASAWRTGSELVPLPTAAALLLIGASIPWAARRPAGSAAVQAAAGAALAVSLLALLGRAYSARPFYELGGTAPAHVGSLLGCAVLALALLLARPEYALSRVLAGRSLGADHLRRTVPALLAVPVATGLLALGGLRAGLYGEEVAFAVFTLLAMAAIGLLGAAGAHRIDVIAREREALEGLFQRTFENASVGVARLDREGRWLHVNARLTEIVGWPRDELIGRSFAEITHAEDLGFDREMVAALARGELDSQHVEKRYVTKQGHPVWVDSFVSAAREDDGRISYLIAVIQDIGARKRAERAKDEFFALVSHELRSPLHVLGAWLSVLRHENEPHTRARALEAAERSADLLNRLIGDLLDASRIASGKLEIEREVFDLLEVVQAVAAAFQPLAVSRGVALELVRPAQASFVVGDAARIEQVVRNLVDNALKFTAPGGRVELRMASADGLASLSVSDTGQGIAPDLLPRIFDRLAQGEGGPRGAGRGLGLGLSIVRHLVELHGGRIEAHSEGPGRGARFVVTLPEVAMPQRLAPSSPADESDALDGVRVLLVKPEREAAEALALAFEAAGASVAWVHSAEEALARTRQRRPHAVVADVDAACDDWAAWLRALRAPGEPRLVALALSAGDHATERRRARAAGFDGFLGRPADPRRIVALVHGLLAAPRRLLVVDDDRDAADSLAILLARRGFEVERAYGAAQALEVAARMQPSVVLTDLQLGTEDGAALARALRASGLAPLRILAISGRGALEAGVEPGLFDGFARKPVDPDALLGLLQDLS